MIISFILVEPAVPGNVGAAARAIKTMGFNNLRLVNPCDYLSIEARMFAHASVEILENAKVFSGLDKALSDVDLAIATTAKTRDARVEFFNNSDIPGIIRSKGNTVKHVGLVFGREESGLSNNEIRLCDLASTIPLKQSYPSLNLGQAVMIYAYSLSNISPEGNITSKNLSGDSKKFRNMMNKSRELLQKIEADKNPALYNRILERIALLEEGDINLLLSVMARLN